ncbi:74_t:CDS:2 [Funneliformis geosporum]|uniref:74_t:CDS:1 n=1 Tax=Funneliformis geosporum TaxID=1117311 RepID=A0A9W4SXV2_9GLOM|nr:74_t:CDS:2 [Funneliformis geosporum]
MSKINPVIPSDIKIISDNETISESESYKSLDEHEQIAFFTRNLSVTEVIHSAFPIKYSKTSPQGVATIFNISS